MTSVDVDAIADRLYGLDPADFTPARDAAVREATDPALRAAVKAMRRPTAAAHAVNVLVRDRPAELEELLALADDLRAAMGHDADAVRRLTEQRRRLIASLVDPDLPAAVQQDVTATLEAATADPSLAAAVRSGRLVKPLRYAGFGELPDLAAAVAGRLPAETTRATKATTTTKGDRRAARRPDSTTEKPAASRRSPPTAAEADLTALRQRVLDLAGAADDAQRRYDVAVKRAAEARQLLELAEAERAEAHRAAREAHKTAEKARSELGRLERR